MLIVFVLRLNIFTFKQFILMLWVCNFVTKTNNSYLKADCFARKCEFHEVRVNTIMMRVNTFMVRVNTPMMRVNTPTVRVNTLMVRVNTLMA
jgi:hypothetical protein